MIVIRVCVSENYFREIDAMTAIPGCCDTVWIGSSGSPEITWHENFTASLKEHVAYARSKGLTPMFELRGLGHDDSRGPTEVGVWGVIGQSLWTSVVNTVRRRQISYLADYLADGLPAYLETDDQAMLIPRVDKDGYCVACTVLNLTIGESQPYKLALRVKPGTPLALCRPEFSDVLLPVEYDDSGIAHVELPELAAWSTATIRAIKK